MDAKVEEFRKGEDFIDREINFSSIRRGYEEEYFREIILLSFISIPKINQRQLKMKKILSPTQIYTNSHCILLYSNNSSQIDEEHAQDISTRKKKRKRKIPRE